MENTYVDALMSKLKFLGEEIAKDRQKIKGILEAVQAKEEQVLYIQKLLEAENVSLNGKSIDGILPKSVADMAYEVLSNSEQKEPVYYRKLADMMLAEGKLIPGQDPGANLIAHLGRDQRFVRTGRGLYGLEEWGLKPIQKTTSRKRKKSK